MRQRARQVSSESKSRQYRRIPALRRESQKKKLSCRSSPSGFWSTACSMRGPNRIKVNNPRSYCAHRQVRDHQVRIGFRSTVTRLTFAAMTRYCSGGSAGRSAEAALRIANMPKSAILEVVLVEARRSSVPGRAFPEVRGARRKGPARLSAETSLGQLSPGAVGGSG